MGLLRDYAYIMLFIQLSFTIINLANLFPIKTDIMGINIFDDMSNTVTEIKERFENAGSTLDYLTAAAMAMILGGKVVIEFFLMVFFGITALLDALLVPESISVPIGLVTGGLILYELGNKLLGRG